MKSADGNEVRFMARAATRTANVFTRVDPETKQQAEAILNQLGIPMSNAIGMFLKQIVLTLICIFALLWMGEIGVYLGIIIVNFIGSLIQLIVTYRYVKSIQKYYR